MHSNVIPLGTLPPAQFASLRSVERTTNRSSGLAPAGAQSTCSIVLVSFRTGPVLIDSLNAALAQDGVNRVILVDNGNPPSAQRAVDSLGNSEDRLKVIRGHGNIGFARGCNLGARAATGSHILLLNPDCLLRPGVVRRGMEVFAEHPSAGALTVRIENMDGTEQRGARRNLLTPWTCIVELTRLDRLLPNRAWVQPVNLNQSVPPAQITSVPCISGAFMLLPRAVYDQIGGMDEDYFLHIEDMDLCLRLHVRGNSILYVPDVAVTHVRGTSEVCPLIVEWHKSVSAIKYFNKYFRSKSAIGLLLIIRSFVMLRFVMKLVPLGVTYTVGKYMKCSSNPVR